MDQNYINLLEGRIVTLEKIVSDLSVQVLRIACCKDPCINELAEMEDKIYRSKIIYDQFKSNLILRENTVHD